MFRKQNVSFKMCYCMPDSNLGACYYNNDRSKDIKKLTIVHGNNQSIVSKSRFPKLSQIIIHPNIFKKHFVP